METKSNCLADISNNSCQLEFKEYTIQPDKSHFVGKNSRLRYEKLTRTSVLKTIDSQKCMNANFLKIEVEKFKHTMILNINNKSYR